MKKMLMVLGVVVLTFSAMAVEKADLDKRIRTIISKLDEMQAKSDKRIPGNLLGKAHGIILMDRSKGGLVFGYENGYGVALTKDAKSGKWSSVAFVNSHEGSFGAQVGGQQSFVAILLMTTNAALTLIDPKVDFGGQAQGTAGNDSSTEDSVEASKPVMIFSDRKGLYGGATVKGGTISPNYEDNRIFYGESHSMEEILFKRKAKPTELVNELTKKLTEYSKEPKKK